MHHGTLKNSYRHQALDLGIDKSIFKSIYSKSPTETMPTEAATSAREQIKDMEIAGTDFSRDALIKQHQIVSMSPAHLN